MARRHTIVLLGLLAVSLAGNLFVAGSMLSRFWGDRGGPTAQSRDERAAQYAATFIVGRGPFPLRERVQKEIGQHREAVQAATDEFRAARREVRAAIRATPFDKDRLDAAITKLRQRNDKVNTLFQTALVDAAAAATPEERAKVEDRRPPR